MPAAELLFVAARWRLRRRVLLLGGAARRRPVLAQRTVRYQVVLALAAVAPLRLGSHRALGGYVVGELAAVVAPGGRERRVVGVIYSEVGRFKSRR